MTTIAMDAPARDPLSLVFAALADPTLDIALRWVLLVLVAVIAGGRVSNAHDAADQAARAAARIASVVAGKLR